MKEKIIKPAAKNYVKTVIEYYKLDIELYIYTTSNRTSHGREWINQDIILSNKLPDNTIYKEVIRLKKENNWMCSFLCGYFMCNMDNLKSKLRKILTAMPD